MVAAYRWLAPLDLAAHEVLSISPGNPDSQAYEI
jgi:hypothetical protein